MRELESSIEAKYFKWAKDKGLLPIKLNLQGRRGMPDRMVLGWKGKMVFIEFKRKGEKAKKLQVITIQELRDRGFKVAVFDDLETAKKYTIMRLLHEV